MLGYRGLAGVFAAPQHGGLGVGQHRLDQLQLPVLGVGAYIMRRNGVQPVGLQAGRAHQTGANQQLQHGIAHKGQCQRRHLMNVNFRFRFKQHNQYR